MVKSIYGLICPKCNAKISISDEKSIIDNSICPYCKSQLPYNENIKNNFEIQKKWLCKDTILGFLLGEIIYIVLCYTPYFFNSKESIYLSCGFVVSLFFVYRILASLFNTTKIIINSEFLIVSTYPFPDNTFKQKIPISSIEQIYYIDEYSKQKNPEQCNIIEGLYALLKHGGIFKIRVKATVEELKRCEILLNKHLGITEYPICSACNLVVENVIFKPSLGVLICPECKDKPLGSGSPLMNPSEYSISIKNQELLIRKKWFNLYNLIFYSVLSFFLSLIYGSSLFHQISSFSSGFNPNCLFLFITIPMTIFAFYSLLYALGIWLNKTDIIVNKNFLSIQTYPVSILSNNHKYSSTSIKQIYCKKKSTPRYNKHGKQTGEHHRYVLMAILESDKTVTLLDFSSPEEPKALEKLMEKALGIENEIVDEEFNNT